MIQGTKKGRLPSRTAAFRITDLRRVGKRLFACPHHWGRCGFRSAWADDEAVCPPYRALVGKKQDLTPFFNVEVAKAARTRPYRAEALRSIHGAAHDQGFREAVKKLLEETG